MHFLLCGACPEDSCISCCLVGDPLCGELFWGDDLWCGGVLRGEFALRGEDRRVDGEDGAGGDKGMRS